jgi:hypothetical protein
LKLERAEISLDVKIVKESAKLQAISVHLPGNTRIQSLLRRTPFWGMSMRLGGIGDASSNGCTNDSIIGTVSHYIGEKGREGTLRI